MFNIHKNNVAYLQFLGGRDTYLYLYLYLYLHRFTPAFSHTKHHLQQKKQINVSLLFDMIFDGIEVGTNFRAANYLIVFHSFLSICTFIFLKQHAIIQKKEPQIA